MKRFFSLLLGLATALSLPGCDYFNLQALQPGVSTGYDVRDRFGKPDMEWLNSDGSTTWEFSRQPEGTDCYMITIGQDNILRSVDQVLTEANYARVQPGMTGEQVRRILGKPASKQFFQLAGETVWQWRIAGDASITDPLFFTASFDTTGKVTKTGRNVEYRGR